MFFTKKPLMLLCKNSSGFVGSELIKTCQKHVRSCKYIFLPFQVVNFESVIPNVVEIMIW
jgi:hypothetical protein